MEKVIEEVKLEIKTYPDFPKPGILFRDIFGVLNNPESFGKLRDVMVEYVKTKIGEVDAIVGLDSRGFLLGSVLALELKLPFVPVRKAGKLPGELIRVTYTLEYGTDSFEMQKGSIRPNQRVLIVDDLIATGGSLVGACQLVRDVGAEVTACLVVMELEDLNGKSKVPVPFHSLMKF